MSVQSEIEEQIRLQFPIFFERKSSIPPDEFFPKYNALVDYAAKAAEPKLTSETSKSQLALISAALLLLTLVFFKVGAVKFGENPVVVDTIVLAWYSAILAALLVAFVARAMLDLYRAKLARKKDQNVVDDLSRVIQRGLNERAVEIFYWFEFFAEASKSVERYMYIQFELGLADTERPPMTYPRPIQNIDELRQLPELVAKIESCETFVRDLLDGLGAAVENFRLDALEIIRTMPDDDGGQAIDRKHRIRTAVDESYSARLEPYFEARITLGFEGMTASNHIPQEVKLLNAQLGVLKQLARLRFLYVLFELTVPTLAVLAVLAYVWFHR